MAFALVRRELTFEELRQLQPVEQWRADLTNIFRTYESWRAFRRRHASVLEQSGAVVRLERGDHVNPSVLNPLLPQLLRGEMQATHQS